MGPLFAVLLLVLTTYRNSWGKVLHTENLFVLHTIVLGLAASAEAWSLDARRRERAPGPERRFGWPVWIVSLVTVATYLVAGLAKLELSGWDWVSGEQLRNQVAFDNLRKDLFGEPASPLAPFLLRHAWLFTPAGVTSLAVELGAPLALLGGWWRRVWVGSAWLFHLAILALMAILFPYQLSGIAFASLYRVERLPDRLRALAGRPARAPPGVGPAVARDSS